MIQVQADREGRIECQRVLLDGGTAILPTDTVYGLAGLADNCQTLDAMFDVKGRNNQSPVAILRPKNPDWSALGVVPSPKLLKIADLFWPGALTLLVHTNRVWDSRVDGGRGILGIRVPDCPWLLELLDGLERPLAVTSANRTGEKEIYHPHDLAVEFRERIDLVVDGGRLPPVKPSTVLDVTGESTCVVRKGAISIVDIQQAIES